MLLIVGFLVMVFIIVSVGLMSGTTPLFFIDLPSALIIIVPLIFFLLASKCGKIINRYIKTSFTKGHTYSGPELAALSAAVRNTVKFILGTGGLGFLIGIIAMLMFLEDRQMIGPNLAVALITLLYSIAVSFFVFFPAQAWAENKLNALKGD